VHIVLVFNVWKGQSLTRQILETEQLQ